MASVGSVGEAMVLVFERDSSSRFCRGEFEADMRDSESGVAWHVSGSGLGLGVLA